MTTITLPPRKPEWLRQQLSQLEQRQEMIRDVIGALLTTKASKGLDTPAIALRALDQANSDLADVQQQLDVLNQGWTTLHPKT